MKDPRLEKLADLLIHHSLKIKEKETVRIEVRDEGIPLAKELIKQVYRQGAYPYTEIRNIEINREELMGTSRERAEWLKKWADSRWKDIDANIVIDGVVNSSELANIPAEKRKIQQKVMKPVQDYIISNVKWVLLNYPTSSMAQKAGMSLDAFTDFYFDVCTVDYEKMERALQPLKHLMENTDEVHIKGPGTDLTFSIKDVPAVPCAGDANIPDGEIFTAPVRDSVQGTLSYNTPTEYEGTSFQNVKLTFKDGKIVDAGANNTKRLNEILDTDEGARYIGEFALGINPYVLEPMNDILFDEKIAGSFHFTPGQAYEDEADNGNRSTVHWDMVCIQRSEHGGGEIYFDGELIRKDGLFVLEALKGLNPDRLKS